MLPTCAWLVIPGTPVKSLRTIVFCTLWGSRWQQKTASAAIRYTDLRSLDTCASFELRLVSTSAHGRNAKLGRSQEDKGRE
jgi:hypothetical protein